jgi:ankyrin repeat protein
MKNRLLPLSTLLMVLTITSGCGKKANDSSSDSDDKTFAPTSAEIYFNTFREAKRAVAENDIEGLKKAIAENPSLDLNQILNDGETFLIIAIKKDFREIRNFLIEKNASLEKPNVNKETPLIAAVSSGRVNSVRILLDSNVDKEKTNVDGDTALHLAIKSKNDELAIMLIRQGSNVESFDKKGRNALMLSEEFSVPLAHDLIRSISQLETGAPDISSFRSLLTTGDISRLGVVLTRYPQLINDYESINPLVLLVDSKDQNNAIKSAELLINHSANVNGPKDADTTPLIKATISQKNGFANLFLNAKANPQLLDKDGKSALIHAIMLNNSDMVDLLLSYSAVEKYTFRKDGKKITYSGCEVAHDIKNTLKDEKEKIENEKIQRSLDCNFFSWFF